ncbi:hypothetical protein EHQ76_16065 [Leptospira barantonii]|uniref:Uncharacterized protein n=1 Tax=Leptospira barantonii TaxID=2023184 RepID=A0A5F2AZD1_9LEPT|nr:hypothetical protein [Leptospira barantonii]TGL96292.1 hypothetical protein EHQ76_16065 [Leptospira barantonii]
MIRKSFWILLFLSLFVNCATWERLTFPERWEWIGTARYKSVQIFVIDPTRDSEIEAEEGTKIRFPFGSLLGSDGNPIQSPIRIEISEYYKNADILLSGLSTASGQSPIQTKGMILLNAFTEKGVKAKPNPKNPPQVLFPSAFEPGYQVFYGTKTNEGNVDWSTETAKTSNVSKNEEGKNLIRSGAEERISALPSLTKNQSAQPTRGESMNMSEGMEASRSFYYPILNLGWINCDRFLYMKIRLLPLTLDVNHPTWEDETTYNLILPSIRSVMPSYKDPAGKVYFPNLPMGEKAIVYALKRSGVKRWQLWIRETVIGKEEKIVPDWELMGPKELERRIQSLNF